MPLYDALPPGLQGYDLGEQRNRQEAQVGLQHYLGTQRLALEQQRAQQAAQRQPIELELLKSKLAEIARVNSARGELKAALPGMFPGQPAVPGMSQNDIDAGGAEYASAEEVAGTPAQADPRARVFGAAIDINPNAVSTMLRGMLPGGRGSGRANAIQELNEYANRLEQEGRFKESELIRKNIESRSQNAYDRGQGAAAWKMYKIDLPNGQSQIVTSEQAAEIARQSGGNVRISEINSNQQPAQRMPSRAPVNPPQNGVVQPVGPIDTEAQLRGAVGAIPSTVPNQNVSVRDVLMQEMEDARRSGNTAEIPKIQAELDRLAPASQGQSMPGITSGKTTEQQITDEANKASKVKTAEGRAKWYGAVQSKVQAARATINKLNRVDQLLGNFEGGLFSELGLEVARGFNSVGFKVDPKLGNKEAAQSISRQFAIALRSQGEEPGQVGMPGHLSDADRDFLVSITPRLAQSSEGRKSIIETMKTVAERQIDYAQKARDWRKQHGDLNWDAFEDSYQQYANNNELFKTKKTRKSNANANDFFR